MARGKSRIKLLLDASQAALFAGIEIHNKPLIEYRYPTAIILIINAWELALKAFVYKYIGKDEIYEKDDKQHTISFSAALAKTRIKVNTIRKNSEFEAVADNLFLLVDYRNNFSHFGDEKLNAVVFMLLNKAVLNYDEFVKEFFSKDISQRDNLIILPIGLKVPIDPVEFLSKRAVDSDNSFVKSVIDSIQKLDQNGIQKTIVVGFDFCMISVKKVNNADIIAAVDNEHPEISIAKEIRITDNPNAPVYRLDKPLLPLQYGDVTNGVKALFPEIKLNNIFYKIMREIKADKRLCETNYLDPKNKRGAKKDYYSSDVVQVVVEKYKQTIGYKDNS